MRGNHDLELRWRLEAVRDSLRPRILVLLGLGGKLKERSLCTLFEETFSDFLLRRPHDVIVFRGYQKKSLKFREWSVRGPKGNEMLIVMWPQHPSPITVHQYRLLDSVVRGVQGAVWFSDRVVSFPDRPPLTGPG